MFLKDAKTVVFHPTACDSLENLTKMLSSGFVSQSSANALNGFYFLLFVTQLQAGCVHFSPPNPSCEIRVLILLYTAEKKAFLGFVPNNQAGFVERLKKTISSQKQQTRQVDSFA